MKLNKKTEQIFFKLLRAGLWERETLLTSIDDIDFMDVYRLAEEQAVVGLVAAGLEHVKDVKAPQEMALTFVGEALQLEQRNTSMNAFIGKLISRMRTVGIYTLLVKGQGVAQCYERPLWRACGDVDLFLSDDNYHKAKEYLCPLASSVEMESLPSKHLGMTIDNWVVELHGALYSSLSQRINKVLKNVTADTFYIGNVRSWLNGNVQVFLLGVDSDIIYTFTHILGHFYKGGIGLRQICDWCRLLWIYRDSINQDLLKERLCSMRLMSEWKAFGAFAVEYLGMPAEAMPIFDNNDNQNNNLKKKAKRIRNFVMEVGNFGHKRDMSYYNSKPYLVRKSISLGRRCGDLFRHAQIFPLDSMRFMPSIIFNGLRSAAKGE